MNIILWIIFGALAGWIASKIMNTDSEQGAIANVLVGVIGAFIGGLVMQLIGGSGVDGFNLRSFVVAVLGAVVFLAVYKTIRGRA
jgi:uncharacterized membrane protein YeaQ/YmgE (transglycosylase-associated protein family)